MVSEVQPLDVTIPPAGYRSGKSIRERGTAALLAVVVALLPLLLLMFLAPDIIKPDKRIPTSFTFDVAGDGDVDPAKPEKPKPEKAKGGRTRDVAPAARPIAKPVEVPPEPPVKLPSSVIWITKQAYAGTDVSKIPSQPSNSTAPPSKEAGESGADDSALASGTAPGGEPLYVAEWYVHPTHAQLSTYLPPNLRQVGWGLIACRTVANYRVEDCQEIADSPRGSRLAGAVRQAAWQFRVRPPRKGGRELVGAWVSIRIDYTVTG